MNNRSNKGYTLIELLVAMTILVIFGITVTNVLISTFRGSKKTTALTNIRQNGNYAISQMTKIIRSGKKLESPVTCYAPAPSPAPTGIPSIQFTGPDNNSTTLKCNNSTDTPPNALVLTVSPSPAIALLNPSTVSTTSCYFICRQTSTADNPVIDINFTLEPYNATPSIAPLAENSASINFQTSVEMRIFK